MLPEARIRARIGEMPTMLRGQHLRLPCAAAIELREGVEVALLFAADRALGATARRPVWPEGVDRWRRLGTFRRGFYRRGRGGARGCGSGCGRIGCREDSLEGELL